MLTCVIYQTISEMLEKKERITFYGQSHLWNLCWYLKLNWFLSMQTNGMDSLQPVSKNPSVSKISLLGDKSSPTVDKQGRKRFGGLRCFLPLYHIALLCHSLMQAIRWKKNKEKYAHYWRFLLNRENWKESWS